MYRILVVVVWGLSTIVSQSSFAQQINLGTLLEEMVDRTKIAEFPNPEYQCKQCSSYNREAVDPGNPAGLPTRTPHSFMVSRKFKADVNGS